jgi:anti-anti-sigma regulatory factor
VVQRLQYVTRSDGDVITVKPVGVLDPVSSSDLRSVLLKALAEAPVAMIVDLAEISVRDTSCLTLFPTIANRAAHNGGTWLLLCAASGPVASSYHELGLDRSVPLLPTWSRAYRLAHAQPPAPRASRRLAPTPDSPRLARQFTTDVCAQWGIPELATERMLLIVTELVSNAVVHAGTPIEIVLRRTPRYIHLAVVDENERSATLRGPEDCHSTSGRGLILVDAFAAAWGCTPMVRGKRTWATVRSVPPPD